MKMKINEIGKREIREFLAANHKLGGALRKKPNP